MAKKISVSEALNLYEEKRKNGSKMSWSILKKRLSANAYPEFKSKVTSLYGGLSTKK